MTTTYAGSDAFPTSITLPADGEPATVSSVNVPFEGLADRTRFLYNRAYLATDGIAYRNLRVPLIKDTSGTAFDFSKIRLDGSGSCPPFWSNTYNLWIKPGNSTAGHFYVGDNGYFTNFLCDAGSPPSVTFGCDSALVASPGRVVLFDSASVSGNPKFILGPISGDFDTGWTTQTLDSNAYGSFVRPNDCAVTPAQTVVVVGGGDASGTGQLIAWRSTDFGTSYARTLVDNAPAFGQFFSRVIVGKSGRLVAWQTTTTAVGGNKIYYSDTDGASWSSRTGIGFDNIADGVYLPDLDLWAFSSGTSIWTTPDPVLSAFTQTSLGATVFALGGFGHVLMYGQSPTASRPELRITLDGFATAARFVGRDPTTRQAYRSVVANPYGQLCVASAGSLVLTERP